MNDIQLYDVEKELLDKLDTLNIAGITERSYPNQQFDTPNNKPWLRAVMTNSNSQIDSDSSGCYEVIGGRFIVSVFWPKFRGTRAAQQAAHAIKRLYETAAMDCVNIGAVNVAPTFEPESSIWYGVNVTINYQYESIRS